MLISGRRLKWGMLLVLIGATLLLIRPLRSMVDRCLVWQWNRNLDVSHLQYHRDRTLLEASDVRFQQEWAGRTYGFHADRAWLAFDPLELLDRHLPISRARLDAVRLYLAEAPQASPLPSNAWDAEIDRHSTHIDWNEVHHRFRQNLAADESYATWKSRIAGWVEQSNQLQSRLQTLMQEEAHDDNPLRLEKELRTKIAQVEELQLQHEQLMRQLVNVNSLVSAKCHQVREEFESCAQAMAEELLGSENVRDSYATIVESLILEIAGAAWQRIADQAAIVDLVADRVIQAPAVASQGRDVPVGCRDTFAFEIRDLVADGVFQHHGAQVPFEMQAAVRVPDEVGPPTTRWSFRFDDSKECVVVRVVEQDGLRSTIHADLCGPAPTGIASPSDRLAEAGEPAWPSESRSAAGQDTWGQERRPVWASLEAYRTESGIEGELRIDIAAAVGQSGQCQEIVEAAQQQAFAQASEVESDFHVQVHGSWAEPVFELQGELPAWLINSVSLQVNEVLATGSNQAKERVRDELNVELSDLRSLVQLSSRQARAIVSSHGQQLSTARDVLIKRLDDMSGKTFATHYGQTVPMR